MELNRPRHDYLILPLSGVLAKSYETCVIVPIFNRPEYLKRCLTSLAASKLSKTLIVLLDDGSDDTHTLQMIESFNHPQADGLWIRRRNRPPQAGLLDTLHHNLMFACNYALSQFDSLYLVILDSDTIVKKNWLPVLRTLYERQADKPFLLLSGFNTPSKKTLSKGKDYYRKQALGGVNLFFTSALYKKLFIPLEPYWDDCLVRRIRAQGYRMLATRPSVVQHIGWRGTFSRSYFLTDKAFDFGRLPRGGKLFYYVTEYPIKRIWMWLSYLKRHLKRQITGN